MRREGAVSGFALFFELRGGISLRYSRAVLAVCGKVGSKKNSRVR